MGDGLIDPLASPPASDKGEPRGPSGNASSLTPPTVAPPLPVVRRKRRTRDLAVFRLRVAVLMAVISLFSAYVTHIATGLGSDAAELYGLASQQSAEEEQTEQHIDGIVAQEQRLTALISTFRHEYVVSLQDALDLRMTNPERAQEFDLEAQGNYDVMRQLWPFYRTALPTDKDGVLTYDAEAAKRALRMSDWRLYRASSATTRQDAATTAGAASNSVLVVVGLVGSLLLLTAAHLYPGRRGRWLAVAGLTVAAVAMAAFVAIAPTAAVPVIAALVGLVVVGFVLRIRVGSPALKGAESINAVPNLVDVPVDPGWGAATDPDARRTTKFTRRVALAIAIATLLGASVGYLHGATSRRADEANWQARDRGVKAIGALRAAEERTTVEVETYQLGLVARIRAWNARQAANVASETGDSARAVELRAEADRLEELAARTYDRNDVSDAIGESGLSDPVALIAIRTLPWRAAAKIAALQDAANATARNLGGQAAVYLSVLAWLAVAVYLLGLSLVFRQRNVRRLFAFVGAALIVGSVLRAGYGATLPGEVPQDRAEGASRAYASGFEALMRNDGAAAAEHMAEATRWRDDFGAAHRDLAQGVMFTESTDGSGIRSVFPEAAVDLALSELALAQKHGIATAGVLLNRAALEFHRSIYREDASSMASVVTGSREGLELGSAFRRTYNAPHITEIIGLANLALGLTATGEIASAERAYRELAAATVELPPHWHSSMVGAGLTTLGILADASPPVDPDTIRRLRELIVASTYGVAQSSPATVEAVSAELFPSLLQWRATIRNFDPERDHLVVQWYRRDEGGDRWYGLPSASGPVALDLPWPGGQFHPDAEPDSYWGNTTAILRDLRPSCTGPGTYRVELYLNGKSTTGADIEAPPTRYVPHLLRDVGFGMCRPTDFVVGPSQPGSHGGIVAGDGSRGITVFRVHRPLEADGSVDLVAAVDKLLRRGPTGLPPGLDEGIALDAAPQPTIFGHRSAVWRLHRWDNGFAKVTAVPEGALGTVLLTVIYGPAEWIDSPDALALVLSLAEHV